MMGAGCQELIAEKKRARSRLARQHQRLDILHSLALVRCHFYAVPSIAMQPQGEREKLDNVLNRADNGAIGCEIQTLACKSVFMLIA
jgi:hypothetical protein